MASFTYSGMPSRALLALCMLAVSTPMAAMAQTQPAAAAPTVQAPALSAQEELVARIALYPDDLVAIILPAATRPLDIVKAQRFLEERKTKKDLKVPEDWDDSVKSLVNYPVVINAMNADLDWTEALGVAVTADQSAVLDAVQAYRRRVNGVGNLKSDEKQTVVVEKEVITIVQADPQVIYVPQYNPATVTYYGGYSSWGYYGSPYPVYYYPYAPGAALAAGVLWGAAVGAIWSGGRYGYNGGNNININNNYNIGNGNRGDINRGDAGRGGGGQNWSPSASQTGSKAGSRIGDPGVSTRQGGGASASNRMAGGGSGAGSGMGSASSRGSGGMVGPGLNDTASSRSSRGGDYGASRSSYGGSSRASAGGGGYGGGYSSGGGSRASAFNSYGGGRSASMSSSRGSMSRGGGGGRRR